MREKCVRNASPKTHQQKPKKQRRRCRTSRASKREVSVVWSLPRATMIGHSDVRGLKARSGQNIAGDATSIVTMSTMTPKKEKKRGY